MSSSEYADLYRARVLELENERGRLHRRIAADQKLFDVMFSRRDRRLDHWWGRLLWWLIRATT